MATFCPCPPKGHASEPRASTSQHLPLKSAALYMDINKLPGHRLYCSRKPTAYDSNVIPIKTPKQTQISCQLQQANCYFYCSMGAPLTLEMQPSVEFHALKCQTHLCSHFISILYCSNLTVIFIRDFPCTQQCNYYSSLVSPKLVYNCLVKQF